MTLFNELGLAEPILRAVAAEGYTNPTPIQEQVIPTMLAGRDLLGTAQTGTGKTASFVLPVLDKLSRTMVPAAPRTCHALIVVPTRELAQQVADSVRNYGRFVNMSSAVVIGGARPGPQVKALSRGVDFVIATPGRLLDHMQTGAIRLDQTDVVVLDEADQMLDLGFMPAIRKILAKMPRERQTVLLSATMPPAIRKLAGDFLRQPAEISVAPVSRPIEQIAQSVINVASAAKRDMLVDILGASDMERAIVFTRTKRGADRVSQHLDKAGLRSAAIHGNKSQNQREKALGAFRNGRVAVLVATDIAARGIDIDDVSHVVNFELPNVPEAYVHRIGRTARAGKSGIAISLCDHSERGLLRDIEKLIGKRIDAHGAAPRSEARGEAIANQVAGGEPVGEADEAPAASVRQQAGERRDERSRQPGKRNSPSRNRRRSGKPVAFEARSEGRNGDAPKEGRNRRPEGAEAGRSAKRTEAGAHKSRNGGANGRRDAGRGNEGAQAGLERMLRKSSKPKAGMGEKRMAAR
ncbi:ATP-dependent RNA helicase RhlE [Rhodopseudomonas julia]|uniref:ATP-dependent RNA helicase RhlE n=1 Tax=Rhodopseudomonas julia TaxID=200617 RepID=A0ABU0C615_9BRAD|nr:DEAD/DEAH box helicase [Rhodopseudomonas julia]MDQ0325963.1 ATP-dependent RNA helicase RhlE [Rhodopseudomonas julia]